MFIVLSLFARTRPPQVCTGPEQLVCSQVVDDHGFSLSTDRVLNLEELKAHHWMCSVVPTQEKKIINLGTYSLHICKVLKA